MAHENDWRPLKGPQTQFLSLTCRECLYGGAAGGGKSESLLVDAVRLVGRGYGSAYHAILLRRTFTELETSLIQRSLDLYPRLGGKYKSDTKVWSFPQGERVRFGHCEHDQDALNYKSAEFQYVGFDEVTEFNQFPYTYLFSRLRSSKGVPLKIRCGSNPGGRGSDWVFNRWRYWLDPDSEIKAAPGQILYIHTNKDGEESVVEKGAPMSLSRCFIPAKLDDNKYLLSTDYEVNLTQLDPVERARLRDGNWLIKPAAGLYFKRAWVELVDAVPDNATYVRYWDRAASEGKGDFTVGVKMAKTPDGTLWVADVDRFRHSPGKVIARIKEVALREPEVLIGLSEDPGSAGKFERESYERELKALHLRYAFQKETGDKLARFRPFSAKAEQHKVKIVKGKWNEQYFVELEGFPDVNHDDQIDATSGSVTFLTRPTIRRAIPAHIIA